MIELKNITKIYNTNGNTGIGLNNVSVSFNKGEFVGVVGPSGSGKTTLLNVVTGMDSYEEGELILFGKDTAGYTQEEFEVYRRNNVSFIFQDYQLIDSYSALDNVVVELLFKGREKNEAIKEATELLTKVGLAHRLKNKASQLSGGEKQRVVIARALASNCQILACDEPTGNLDSNNSIEIINLLKEISKEKLVLFVTHDPELLENVATRILTIKDGNIFSDEISNKVEDSTMNIANQNKIKLSTNFFIAIKNILSTPKKTIMLSIIFIVATLFIITNFTQINFNFSDSLKISELYTNTTPNRVIVYDDVDYNKGIKVANDNFLDSYIVVESLLSITPMAYVSVLVEDVTIGRTPEKSNEIVLSLTSLIFDIMTEESTDIFTEDLKATINGEEYFIVGLISDESLLFSRVFFYNNELPRLNQSLCDDVILREGNQRINFGKIESDENYLLQIPNDTKLEDINFTIGNKKIELTEDMVARSTYSSYMINESYLNYYCEDFIYRTSFIFEDDIDAKEAFEYFSSKGYTTIYPDSFEYEKNIMYYVEFAVSLVSIISVVFTMCIVIIIVTVISGLVFKTTVKDFNIMRIIGLSKKDVFIVLIIQVYTLLLVSFITSLLLVLILSITPIGTLMMLPYIIKNLFLFKNISLLIIIIILLGFFIARSHHKRIFKVSATTNLRGGNV